MLSALLTWLVTTSDVKVWVRPAGDYGAQPAPTPVERIVTVTPTATRELFDLQYQEKLLYRGMPLAAVVGSNANGATVDTALLHFANGMIVPVPLASPLQQKLFVAVERKTDKGDFVTSFVEVRKHDGLYPDNRPLTFSTNKLVVETPAHPAVTDPGNKFSPWLSVDSLVGVELVQSEPYLAQFDVDPSGAAGLARFRQRCQFCHGARGVGASYGWDYVRPVALYTYRSPRSLYFHVKYRDSDAAEKGLMMPALSDITEKDAEYLWAFLRVLAEKPLRPYQPAVTLP